MLEIYRTKNKRGLPPADQSKMENLTVGTAETVDQYQRIMFSENGQDKSTLDTEILRLFQQLSTTKKQDFLEMIISAAAGRETCSHEIYG